jgi:predicted hydrocarbon binding protein
MVVGRFAGIFRLVEGRLVFSVFSIKRRYNRLRGKQKIVDRSKIIIYRRNFKMENVFQADTVRAFHWGNLGDVREGRGNLGEEMPIVLYRLMQFTIVDVLSREHGLEKAYDYVRRAGHLAGSEYAKNALDLKLEFAQFISHLQQGLKDLKVGVLRMESHNETTGELVMSIAEDLDCSGLPITGENVCVYDEGFIAGILECYIGKPYNVREVDCWASGGRVCRFRGVPA